MPSSEHTLLAEEYDDALVETANNENIAFLALIAPNYPVNITPSRSAFAQIGINEEYAVRKAIKMIKENSNTDKLFFLINSPGGIVQSSYIIAHALQESFKEITVFIPHIAASGATLISLVGKHVVMDGLISRISPLDPQITYKGEYKSVNTIIRSFKNLNAYFGDMHEDDSPYPSKVLADKHDPVNLQECFDTIDLMSMYALNVLAHKNNRYVRYNENIPLEEDLKTVKGMVEKFLSLEYPLHEYAILANEVKEIGLNVYDVSKIEDIESLHNEFNNTINFKHAWQEIVDWFEKYKDIPSANHFVRYIVPLRENGT